MRSWKIPNAERDAGSGVTYVAYAPTVTGVAPTTGSNAGGNAVTISGTTYVSGATVTIRRRAATNVAVVERHFG